MKPRNIHYKLLNSLTSFALNSEEESLNLTSNEIDERLISQGVNVSALETAITTQLQSLRSMMHSSSVTATPPKRRTRHRELLVANKADIPPDQSLSENTEDTSNG